MAKNLIPVPFPPSSSLLKSGRSAQDAGKGCLLATPAPAASAGEVTSLRECVVHGRERYQKERW